MKKKKTAPAKKGDAAAQLTYAEARHIAGTVEAEFEDRPRDMVRLVLLLRWLAYHATANERETLYIETEGLAMPYMQGMSEAVERQMLAELDALRREGGA